MESCNVCVGNINKKNKKVECPTCNYSCCHLCVEQYLKITGCSPKCMNCNIPWSRETLKSMFREASIKRMLDLRKTVLLHEQEAKLSLTQEYVSIENENITLRDQVSALRSQINKINIDISRNYGRIREIERGSTSTERATNVHVKICGKDDCRGFIKSANYTCGLCNNKVCKKCLMDIEEEHECDDSDVETAKLMMKNMKGCPSCHVPIFKINGCNHMFCVSCKTAFDWQTLKIHVNGNSNPHYFDWIRSSTGQTPIPRPECGANYSIHMLVGNPRYKQLSSQVQTEIMGYFRRIDHMSAILPQLSGEITFLKLRAQYLKNEIDVTTFKNKISKIHCDNEYKTAINIIFETVFQIKQDFINRMFDAENQKQIEMLKEELKIFLKNTNDSVNKCGHVYNRDVNKFHFKISRVE